MTTTDQILQALQTVVDPNTGKDFVSTKALRNLQFAGGELSFDVELGYPAASQIPALRRALIAAADDAPPDPHRDDTGASKLFLLRRCLALRRDHPDLAPDAAYTPLPVSGAAADRAIAFVRGAGIVVIAPVRTWQPDWRGSCVRLPAGTWHDVLTGRRHPGGGACRLEAAFDAWPVALLERR